MDRGSRDWPGGPVSPGPYPYERFGGKFPLHEVAAHGPVVRRECLAECVDVPTLSLPVNVRVDMAVPDGRLLSVLSIYFVPAVPSVLPTRTFQATTIHLLSMVNDESGPYEGEDLLGTRAAPMPFPQAGLWGVQYSPTEEIEYLRAELALGSCGTDGPIPGKWWAQGRWQELRPMSEIDWRDALGKMQLIASPKGQRIIADART